MDVNVPPVCAPEKDVGTCKGYSPRYYFNSRNLRCELFVWSGCGGNSNNFESKEICEFTCPGISLISIHAHLYSFCDIFVNYFLPLVFDRINNHRDLFIASTLEPLPLPVVEQPREQFNQALPRNVGAFNQRNQILNNFIPTNNIGPVILPPNICCVQNVPQLQNIVAPQCNIPKDPGPCYGYIPRWYYEFGVQQCVLFIYGGCQGNSNNFVTKEDCEFVCRSKI